MQIYFHSHPCSYLPRVPILVEGTVYIYICICVYIYNILLYIYNNIIFCYIYIYIYITKSTDKNTVKVPDR